MTKIVNFVQTVDTCILSTLFRSGIQNVFENCTFMYSRSIFCNNQHVPRLLLVVSEMGIQHRNVFKIKHSTGTTSVYQVLLVYAFVVQQYFCLTISPFCHHVQMSVRQDVKQSRYKNKK